jgi:hypothetical protein
MRRLAELAELDQVDDEGNLIPLNKLREVDRRVIAVAANAILDRALGKPKEPPGDSGGPEALRNMSAEDRLRRVHELLTYAATLPIPGALVEAETSEGEAGT